MSGARGRTLPVEAGVQAYTFVDDRLNQSGGWIKRNIRKVFPDHWSFLLGEITLHSFILLLLTGTFLTLFFHPSDREVLYNGAYVPLHGVKMSAAYASTMHISFDVRGGLLVRQMHHWAALIFIGTMVFHACRIFFTGAFRKPREITWVIGVTLMTMAILEGFAGYSLPDDLLSGTGLRIGYSVLESIPVVGSWAAMLVFGGEFPGDGFISRLYAIHILLIPGVMAALLTAHLMLVWRQKHTDFPRVGKTEMNVVGSAFFPRFIAKAGGLAMSVFGIVALLGGLVQINPVWYYGPFDPAQVSAGSQPDFYLGFLEGSLRMMPGLEMSLWGYTISLNLLLPGVVLPGLMFTAMYAYPWIEKRWITKDTGYHNLLERPRENPTRTAIGWMALTFYLVLLAAGGNDVLAKTLHISLYWTTYFFRAAIIVAPALAFYVARRVCLGLLAHEHEAHEHGIETGTVVRLPHGEFIEVHAPAADEPGPPRIAQHAQDRHALEAPHPDDDLLVGVGHTVGRAGEEEALPEGARSRLAARLQRGRREQP